MELLDTTPAASDNRSSPAPQSGGGNDKASHTPVIVGVVVGIVGGLLLLGLAVWLWRRKHKQGVEEPARNRSPVHRVVQEEDAGEVLEYLPPQYRETWQQSLSTPSVSSAESPASSYPSTFKEPLVSPSSSGEPPVATPTLKRDYIRHFNLWRHKATQDSEQATPLEEEYKRVLQQRHAPEQVRPASARIDLKDE